MNEPRKMEASEQLSNLRRAMNGLRVALPYVQKVLPLLEGRVVTTVSNLLAPQHPPAPPVDIAPLEGGMAELQTKYGALGDQAAEQNAALKRLEDGLETMREAVDRNVQEQREITKSLKAAGRRAKLIALVALGLLVVSIVLNAALYFHVQRALR